MASSKKIEKVDSVSSSPSPEETKFSLSFSISENFKAKLPLLVLMALFFLASAVMFDKSNFRTSDMFDLSRIEYNLAKLYSISFIIFLVLFSLTLALAVYFGDNLPKLNALLPLPLLLVVAIAVGVFIPALMLVFIAFALTITAASFVSSMRNSLTFGGIWSTVGTALMLLLLFSFVITFMKVESNKAVYVDTMINGAIAMIPNSGQQVSSAVAGINIDENTLKGVIKKEYLSNAVSTDQIKTAIRTIPGVAQQPDASQIKWAGDVKTALLKDDKIYNSLISNVSSSLNALKNQLAQPSQQTDANVNANLTSMVRQQLNGLPGFKQVVDNIGFIMAIAVLSLVSVVNLVIKAVATLLCSLLARL